MYEEKEQEQVGSVDRIEPVSPFKVFARINKLESLFTSADPPTIRCVRLTLKSTVQLLDAYKCFNNGCKSVI